MKKRPRILILLTACINPNQTNNRWHKLNDVNVRLKHYLDSIKFFSENTDFHLLFTENSGYPIYEEPNIKHLIDNQRLEVLSYIASDEIRKKGKATGEQDIIKYSVNNSEFWKNADYIIKITGRLKVENIHSFVKALGVLTQITSKNLFIGEKLFKAEWMQSYFFIAHKSFFDDNFFEEMSTLSERDGEIKLFEQGLYQSVNKWKQKKENKVVILPLPILAIGSKGEGGNYYDNSLRHRTKCIIDAFRCNILNRL